MEDHRIEKRPVLRNCYGLMAAVRGRRNVAWATAVKLEGNA
jgi:hypothetical protein